MISRIEGKVALKTERFIVVDVNGVGYKVTIPLHILKRVQKDKIISLWTHLAVKEDSLDLYGFEDTSELGFFEMLISISGIGPRSAIGVIDVAPVEATKKAIGAGDTSYLTKVSGIGKKTAEKIVFELKDKLYSGESFKEELAEEKDIIEALKSMGYNTGEAVDALKKMPKEITGTENKIKEALKILGKN